MKQYTVYQLKYLELEKVPGDLLEQFLPRTEQQYKQFEDNYYAFKKRSKNRDGMIALQKKCGLPFRPNDTMRHTMILMRIQAMKDRKNNPSTEDLKGGEDE